MNIIHISHSDSVGGAARAAYRLHTAQISSGLNSRMLVRKKQTDDWRIEGPITNNEKFLNLLRSSTGSKINNLQRSSNINYHTGNWLPSLWAKKINSSNIDIVNLHWVAGETMSIEDIGRINKPIVWTLHDMWPFCGTEHVTDYEDNARWKIGYTSKNRACLDKGIDLDLLAWLRKKRAWQGKIMHIVAPSKWMAECARDSILFKKYPITVIPNALNTNVYKPLNQGFCRNILNLPKDKKIILFGALGGGKDLNKGHDLLIAALDYLKTKINNDKILCVIFGQDEPKDSVIIPFETKWLGHIHDDTTLSLIYNSADVMIIPSRIDNLPQTATEAQACGIPIVAFATTGLNDIVKHEKTGYLVQPFDTNELALAIIRVFENNIINMAENSRINALTNWEATSICQQYLSLYNEITNSK